MSNPLVLCGPSGSGKSTLMKMLMKDFPSSFAFCVSHTTRSPRCGEVDGKEYNFVTREVMKAMEARGEFLETAEFSDNMYGTSKSAVRKVLEQGKICILDIDVHGCESVKRSKDIASPSFVFVRPPSLQVLEARLRARGTETEETLAKRLQTAAREMKYADTEGNVDIVIVNDDLDRAYEELKTFVMPKIEKLEASRKGETNASNATYM